MTKTAGAKRKATNLKRRQKHCRTGKEWFNTRADAENARIKYSLIRGSVKVPVRSYRCEFCGSYHLTSKPFKPNN